jgi:hypothetical protein
MPPENYEKRKLEKLLEKLKYYEGILNDSNKTEYSIFQKTLAKNMIDYVKQYPN